MESNSHGYYSKRFVEESPRKDPQSPEVDQKVGDSQERSGRPIEDRGLTEQTIPNGSLSSPTDKGPSRTLTQLKNVEASDKEYYPKHFLVLEGGLDHGRVNSQPADRGSLQSLESLADSAAEYEVAKALLTLDRLVSDTYSARENKPDPDQNQQLLKEQEPTGVNKSEERVSCVASTMSNDIKQIVVEGGAQQVNMLDQTNLPAAASPPQTVAVSAPAQQNGSTMQPLQTTNTQHPTQISAEWGPGRVQVIQQPLQNSTYLQQLYNAQGSLLMPGNIALHPGINSQQIQVITAGKAFQGNQLAPHMLTAQGKQVLQGQAVNFTGLTTYQEQAPFPGYTIPTSQNQTFVFSPLNVINTQPSILPAPAQTQAVVSTGSQTQKVMTGVKVTSTKTAAGVSQTPQTQILSPLQGGGQAMQFAPWQLSGAQVWAGGPIFLRGPQSDTPSMFIHHSPQQNNVTCQSNWKPRPQLSAILPSSAVRPASSVSTQTGSGQSKHRSKPGSPRTPPAAKQDAANQTNKQAKQQLLLVNTTGQISDKQQLTKSIQQQVIIQQQQAIQQHQIQQHQVVQQQTSQQQIVQHYPQAMTSLQHAAANQTIPMTAMSQLSMVPQLHQSLMQGGLVQTTSGIQTSQAFSHAPMHTLTLQTGAAMGLVAPSLQTGLVAPTLQTGLVAPTLQTGLVAPTLQTGLVTPTLQTGLVTPTLQAGLVTPTLQTGLVTPTLQTGLVAPTMQTGLVAPTTQTGMMAATTQTGLVASTTQTGLLVSTSQTGLAAPTTQTGLVATTTQTELVAPTTQTGLLTPTLQTELLGAQTSQPKPEEDKLQIDGSSMSPAASSLLVSTCDATPSSTDSCMSDAPALELAVPATSADTPTAAAVTTPDTSCVTSPVMSPVASRATSPDTSRVSSPVTSRLTSPATSRVNSRITSPVSSSAPDPVPTPAARHAALSQLVSQDKSLPKAMIKPILTHVIEGYVIQEAAEPFAVNRPFRDWGSDKETPEPARPDEPPRKRALLDSSSDAPQMPSEEPERAHTPAAPADPRPDIRDWTMTEVSSFVRTIPGGAEYAAEFLAQEVDGPALLLVRPEHLVMALSMKLGPALKVVASVDAIRPAEDDDRDHSTRTSH